MKLVNKSTKDQTFARYFTEANSRKGNKSVENSKKWFSLRLSVAMATMCNILILMKKEIPGVWLIFTVNARSLNPNLKQINSLLVFYPSSGVHTVNTVGSHLNGCQLLK